MSEICKNNCQNPYNICYDNYLNTNACTECTGLICGSLTVGYQKKVPAGRIKPAFFVSNFWFLSIVFYCNVL